MKKINIKRLYRRFKNEYLNTNNVVVAIAFIIAANLVWGSMTVMQRNFKLQKELDDKSRQLIVADLDTANAKLEQRYYKTDEYIELAVRTRLGLVTYGERALILPKNSTGVISADEGYVSKPSDKSIKSSNFQQWMNFLFGGNSKSISK